MENLKNSLVLFDVDGTLTEARKRIDKSVINSLRELSFNTEIGLLTGSGLDYIKEQLWPLLADQELSLNCHVLPCNGIEYYIPNPVPVKLHYFLNLDLISSSHSGFLVLITKYANTLKTTKTINVSMFYSL